MKRKRNTSEHDEHKVPSRILLDSMLRSGAGKHQESKEERNKRTGRLRGSEKKNLSHDD